MIMILGYTNTMIVTITYASTTSQATSRFSTILFILITNTCCLVAQYQYQLVFLVLVGIVTSILVLVVLRSMQDYYALATIVLVTSLLPIISYCQLLGYQYQYYQLLGLLVVSSQQLVVRVLLLGLHILSSQSMYGQQQQQQQQ